MSTESESSQPWNGDYNLRGSSLTFTNVNNVPFVYHLCLIDFPSSYAWMGDGSPFNSNGITQIDNPGTFNYNPDEQYFAINRTLVFYENSYYYCLQDTTGDFNNDCWLFAGANSYQLNYTFQDMGDGWPQSDSSSYTLTYNLPLFTTTADYNPADGPIVSVAITNYTNSNAIAGDPNKGRPPIVNLPMRANPGVPEFVVYNSLTQPDQNFVIVGVNTGADAGFANSFGITASGVTSDGVAVFNAALKANNKTNPVAAIGCLVMQPPLMLANFGVTIGSNDTVYDGPNPLSSCAHYIQI